MPTKTNLQKRSLDKTLQKFNLKVVNKRKHPKSRAKWTSIKHCPKKFPSFYVGNGRLSI